jgi:hypothetical protein
MLAATCLLACAPQLNWRDVELGSLHTLLPCKPDTASRVVVLGAQVVHMDMAGCEVGGALFAISRVRGNDPAQAASLLVLLRQASLANIGNPVVHPLANSGDAFTSFDIQVDGHGTDGTPLQVRLKWLLAGQDIFQLAVYAKALAVEQTENLITQAHIR